MNVINLTPHAINVYDGGTPAVIIPPSGAIARCTMTEEPGGFLALGGQPIPLYRTRYGAVEGLPPQSDGTLYIVSALVAAALPEREDLLTVARPVRNAEGQVIGCEGFNLSRAQK